MSALGFKARVDSSLKYNVLFNIFTHRKGKIMFSRASVCSQGGRGMGGGPVGVGYLRYQVLSGGIGYAWYQVPSGG